MKGTQARPNNMQARSVSSRKLMAPRDIHMSYNPPAGALGRDLDTGSLAQDMFSIDKLDFATLASFSIIVGFPGGS